MNNILYMVAVFFVIIWAVAFLGLHAGNLIHALLIIAFIAILLRIIRGGKSKSN